MSRYGDEEQMEDADPPRSGHPGLIAHWIQEFGVNFAPLGAAEGAERELNGFAPSL